MHDTNIVSQKEKKPNKRTKLGKSKSKKKQTYPELVEKGFSEEKN